MDDELVGPEPAPRPSSRGHRYRRHELELADGGRLVLGADGTIEHRDPHGATTQSWKPDDPEWPGQAIRFGLRPTTPTVKPQGRRVQGTRPPRA